MILALLSCTSPNGPDSQRERTYQITGEVVVIPEGTGRVALRHDAIPGVSNGGIMEYPVRDVEDLRNVLPKDTISATLVEVGPRVWLQGITVVGRSGQPSGNRR